MPRELTPAQREALARGRATANENRRRERQRREAGIIVEDVSDAELAAASTRDTPPQEPAADTAPRATRRGRPAGSTTHGSTTHTAGLRKIRDGLVSLFTMTGVGLSMVDAYDGQVVALNAGRLADSWTDLAAQDARVRKALDALLAGSAWGTAITTTAMVALPIAAHHRLAPPEVGMMAAQAGIVVPDATPAEAPQVRVQRRPMGEPEPAPGDPLAAPHAPSRAPEETAPVPPSDEVAAWDASSVPEVVDAGGIEFPAPPTAPPAGG